MSSSEINSSGLPDETAELELKWRECVLFAGLQESIPERQDRGKFYRGRFSLGRIGLNTTLGRSRLTYGDVVKNDYSGEENAESLNDFVKRNDREANLILAETHLDMLKDYVVVRAVPDRTPQELEGYPVTSLEDPWGHMVSRGGRFRWQTPYIEGRGWARVDKINISRDDSVAIYAPWVTLTQEGGSPFPVIYSRGDISTSLITRLASSYGDFLRGNFRAKLFGDNQKIEQDSDLL